MKKAKIIKRILIITTAIILIPFVLYGAFLLFVPISRTDTAVRDYVFQKVPKGTSWNDTIEIINKNSWKIKQTDNNCGIRIGQDGTDYGFASEEEMKNGSEHSHILVVGVKSMLVELGEFYSPLHTAVYAYMAFDENDELLEVSIRRDIDSL